MFNLSSEYVYHFFNCPTKADLSEVCSNSNESVDLLLLLILYISMIVHVPLQVLKLYWFEQNMYWLRMFTGYM